MTIFQAVEARQVGGSLGGNKCKVEGQAVLHEGYLHALDNCTFVLEHLNGQLLDVTIAIVELLDIEFVEDTDSQAFKQAWGVDLIVFNALDVADLMHLCEIKAV